MARLQGDEPVHGLADPPVRRVPLRRGPQLDHVHGLARVELHVEAHPISHGYHVGRYLRGARRHEPLVELRRIVHHAPPVGQRPHRLDLVGADPAVARGQGLPFQCQQTVALEIAEGAIVAEHVEAVRRPLEGAARLVAAVGTRAHVGLQHPAPLLGPELARHGQ